MKNDLVKGLAKKLAAMDGHNPDEYWEDFDRNAAATLSTVGDYTGWEDDVFPKTFRWQDYEHKATVLVDFILENISKKILELKNG